MPSFDREDRRAEVQRTATKPKRRRKVTVRPPKPKPADALRVEPEHRDAPVARTALGARDTPGQDARDARRVVVRRRRDQPTTIERLADAKKSRKGSGFGDLGGFGGTIAGDLEQLASGMYGSAVDYGDTFGRDVTDLPKAFTGDQLPFSGTGRMAARDALGFVGALENAIPEPGWLPDFMKKEIVSVDPESLEIKRGSGKIDPDDVARARAAWGDDPLISALLFVPAGTAIARRTSEGLIAANVKRSLPPLEAPHPDDFAATQAWGGTRSQIAKEALEAPEHSTKVVVRDEHGARAIGAYRVVGKDLVIDRLAARGGGGHGSAMLQQLADLAAKDGLGMRVFSVDSAEDFYTAKGFQPNGKRGAFFLNFDQVKVLADEGRLVSRREARRLAKKESRQPGYLSAQGFEGGIKPRVVGPGPRGETPTAGQAIGRPWSRSPIGRAGQNLYDFGSDFVELRFGPEAPFSPSRRAARATQKAGDRSRNRLEAWVARRERTINDATKNDVPMREALVATLEGPTTFTPRQAVETKLAHLRSLEQTPALLERMGTLEAALATGKLDSPSFAKALKAMEELSAEANKYATEHLGMDEAALASRQNRVVDAWVEAGLLPEGVGPVARGYWPHRSDFETVPATTNPVGFAASGQTVGTPKLPRALERRQNELQLYGSGKVSSDPKVLSDTLRGRERYAQTLERRRWAYSGASPLVEGAELPERGWIFVRNPDALPNKIPDEVQAALRDPERFSDPDVQRGWLAEWSRPAQDGVPAEWASDLDNVRLMPESVARALLPDAFTSAPRGNVAALAGLLNSLVRTTVLYAPDFGARYVARNTAQNLVALAVTQPKAFVRLARDVRKLDRDMFDSIKVEAGTVRAAAGLPERLRGANTLQSAERGFTNWQRRFANALGNVADEPWRIASWLQYAKDYGFKNEAAWRELLTSTDRRVETIRGDIAQRVREDMFDFDATTPAERETLSRFLFIWNFKRAAAKWPLMYLRERPTQAAIAALIAAQHEREGAEHGSVDGMELGWLSPFAPFQEDVESAASLVGGLSEGDRVSLREAADLLSPQYRELGEALFYPGGADYEGIARVTVPGFSNAQRIEEAETPFGYIMRELGLTRGSRQSSSSVQEKWDKWQEGFRATYGRDLPPEVRAAVDAKIEWESMEDRGDPDEDETISMSRLEKKLDLAIRYHPELVKFRARMLSDAAKSIALRRDVDAAIESWLQWNVLRSDSEGINAFAASQG